MGFLVNGDDTRVRRDCSTTPTGGVAATHVPLAAVARLIAVSRSTPVVRYKTVGSTSTLPTSKEKFKKLPKTRKGDEGASGLRTSCRAEVGNVCQDGEHGADQLLRFVREEQRLGFTIQRHDGSVLGDGRAADVGQQADQDAQANLEQGIGDGCASLDLAAISTLAQN